MEPLGTGAIRTLTVFCTKIDNFPNKINNFQVQSEVLHVAKNACDKYKVCVQCFLKDFLQCAHTVFRLLFGPMGSLAASFW